MSNVRTRVRLGVLWRAWQQCSLYVYTPKLLPHARDTLDIYSQMGCKTKLLHILQEVIEPRRDEKCIAATAELPVPKTRLARTLYTVYGQISRKEHLIIVKPSHRVLTFYTQHILVSLQRTGVNRVAKQSSCRRSGIPASLIMRKQTSVTFLFGAQNFSPLLELSLLSPLLLAELLVKV